MLTNLIVVLQIFLFLFKVEPFKFHHLKTHIWVLGANDIYRWKAVDLSFLTIWQQLSFYF